MIKMHDIFNKHGSTGKLPRPRPTDIIYVISNGYATFQSLILIISMNKLKLNIDLIILTISITTFISVITYNIITCGIINYISFNGI